MFLLTVALIWSVAAVTPGPNFLVVASTAMPGTRRIALATVLGTLLGTLLWGLAGWLGISVLFAAAPLAYATLKIAGGLYIAWLGVRLLWSAIRSGDTQAPPPRTPQRRIRDGIRLGFMTNIANPKSAVFVASLFAAALPPDYHWTQGLSAIAMMVAISTTWYTLVALALTHPALAERFRRTRRAIDTATGAVFIAFSAQFALSER